VHEIKPVRRALWILVSLLSLSFCTLGGAQLYFRNMAFRLFHSGPYHTVRSLIAPPEAAQNQALLDQDLKTLQQLEPGLAAVERKFLGQPLEETQNYYMTLGMLALQKNDKQRWELTCRLLSEIWLQERQASQLDLERVQALIQFQHRIRGFFAAARLKRRRVALPSIAPKAWAGRISLGHRLLVNYRIQQLEKWEIQGYFGPWARACATLRQLDQWHHQLDADQPLSPPSLPLQALYRVLQDLQKGP